MHSITIEVFRQWDGKQMRTDGLVPNGSSSVLIDWQRDPPLDEEGLPLDLAASLARGLLTLGTVSGRWFEDAPPPPGMELWKTEPRNPLQRIADHFTNFSPAHVYTTRSADLVCHLLDQGWGMQQQALLLLGTYSVAQPNEALSALSTTRDWTTFTFPPPALSLIAPGNDGDYILVAAVDEASLKPVLDSILGSFRASGFIVVE